ncbi:hypothetical protein LTS18_010836, partial [Coniosporium uncinatum]
MAYLRYANQSAPFWDFVASLEREGNNPFAAGNSRENNNNNNNHNNNNNPGESSEEDNAWAWSPWTRGPFGVANPWAGQGGRRGGPPHGQHQSPMPHRHHGPPGPPGPPHGERHPPPHHEGPLGPPEHGMPPPPPPPPEYDGPASPEGHHDEKRGPPGPPPPPPGHEGEAGPSHPYRRHSHDGPGPHRHSRCGARGFGRGGRGFGRGGWGGHPAFAGGAPFNFGALAEMFQSQLFGEDKERSGESEETNFRPDVDVFDTPEAFVVHVSLPGAKKEDIGVNWDDSKSELSIGGVVYRPAEEEMLNHLAMNERKVGVFDRKVRLGSRANPAQVDAEGIT